MTARGGKVARYDNALSLLPSEIRLSGDGGIPVTIYYTDEVLTFAKGGLVKDADRIKRAGRYGDTEIVHVNKAELEELRELWGEPTINPETGCPEYFLKKLWKGVKKIAKPLAKIAPIAAMFIPGVGPLAAAAIGAASGAIGGGGLKGALVGGALGGLGASGAAGKAVSSIAPGLSPVAQRAASSAILGGLGSAARGDNVLNGALTAGALGAAVGPGGLIGRGPTTISGAPASGPATQGGAMSVNAPGINGASVSPYTVNPAMTGPVIDTTAPFAVSPDTSALAQNLPDLQKPWLQRPFLNGAISDKIPNWAGYGAGALALSSLMKSAPKQDGSGITAKMPVDEIVDKRFQPVFKANLPAPTGNYAKLAARPVNFGSLEDQYRYGQGPERAYFDYVGYKEGGSTRKEFAVRGKGTGRSDEIPAMLSDGEYVIDAETVALLGDGSNEAGARKLDDMRVNLRKHKGKNLAKGKFSVDAKRPEAYMTGGAV